MAVYWRGVFKTDGNARISMSAGSGYVEASTTITVTANDGYVLDTLTAETNTGGKADFSGEVKGQQEFKFVPFKHLQDGYSTNKVTIVATTTEVEKGVNVEYSQTLENVKSNLSDGGAVDETTVLELTSERYHLFEDITVTLTIDGKESTHIFNIDENKSLFSNDFSKFTLPLKNYWDNKLENVSVEANAVKFIAYSEQLENTVSNMSDKTRVDENDVIKISVDDSGIYDLKDGIKVSYVYSGNTRNVNYQHENYPDYFNDDITEFTLPIAYEWSSDLNEVKVTAIGREIPPPKEARYIQTLQNVESNIIVTPDEDDSTVSRGKVYEDETLVLTALPNYQIQDVINIRFNRERNVGITKTFYPNSESDKEFFNDDNTVFSVKLAEYWAYDVNSIIVHAQAKEVYSGDEDNDEIDSQTSDFANVYHVDSGVLSTIASERFSKELTGQSPYEMMNYDIGQYIYQVYKFPFKIDDSFISNTQSKIQIGYRTLDTLSHYFLRSRLKFDLGTIMVPEQYNNVYDYRDTQCLLHVPYAEPIEIPTTYVVGQMLELVYYLDLYNGIVTLEVYSDKIDGGLVQREIDIPVAFDIPFIQSNLKGIVNKLGGYINNKVKRPYIEVVRNIPYDTSTVFGKEGKEYGKLNDFRGYIEVADLDLSSVATQTEQEQIESLLAQGVVINKTKDEQVESIN